jgi:hypothetical protein
VRTVQAQRYVMPFREGGSVPALVEGDDEGLYVVKLRGAGQGPRALIAELVTGELARIAGLPVPEIVLVDLAAALADSEPDPELSKPLADSVGVNVGLDYLPGSVTFDPIADPPPDEALASMLVVFDAFSLNVDRTPRNPNLLSWHRRLWLIDHGASLYVHHGWRPESALDGVGDPFAEVKDHVLLPRASRLDEAASILERAVTDTHIDAIVDLVPSLWLAGASPFTAERDERGAYRTWLRARLRAMPNYLEEAKRARSLLI